MSGVGLSYPLGADLERGVKKPPRWAAGTEDGILPCLASIESSFSKFEQASACTAPGLLVGDE